MNTVTFSGALSPLIPNLFRFDRTSEEDAVSQIIADLMDIHIELEPQENFDSGKTGLIEERKGKRGGRGTKKYMMRTGKRAGLISNKNTNTMFITRHGKRSGRRAGLFSNKNTNFMLFMIRI